MSTILHLSDLHLGKGDVWERETDDKVGLVPQEEDSRLAVLKTSLDAIKRYLKSECLDLDALVISGDLTSQHDPEGFARFQALLDDVKLVGPRQTIVVPGNHDVDWESDPGTLRKYELFLKHTRERELRTPLCDGVDFPGESNAEPLLALPDCVVVALNSANWCGWRRSGGRGKKETFDVARVSDPQLNRLTDLMRDHDTSALVRIAVLHHHLLPVSEVEEVKYFESVTNLARLRAWLRDHRFHVVLHGHKHQPALTWDHIYEFDHYDRPAHRVFVVSAPTPTTWGAPICRLIRIGESAGRDPVRHAPRLAVETVQAERHERRLEPSQVAVQLDSGPVMPPGLVAIDAPTADAAYERLIHELEARPGILHNVTCVVRDPESAERPPTNFTGDIDEPGTWLKDAVAWWQDAAPELVASGEAPFNHGERLYASGLGKGALDRAAERLGSTKAMVLVLRDSELRAGGEAPAFVAVQLVRARDEAGERLDCIGYFRKQDLTLWWPVNIAELRTIQKYVLDLPHAKRLHAGRLVTIAAEAIYDNVLPELAGAQVDRLVDLRPETLMEMAYRVAHATPDEREEVNKLWTDVLLDIGGPDKKDRILDFPSLGIERLLDHLRVFRDVGGKTQLRLLIKRLEAVADRAQRAKRESKTNTDRERFAKELFELVGEVLSAVDEVMPREPAPEQSRSGTSEARSATRRMPVAPDQTQSATSRALSEERESPPTSD